MAGGAGADALSGIPATLHKGDAMPAAVGAFTVAGQTVTLRVARRMPADTAA
jgi:hypothetical protein